MSLTYFNYVSISLIREINHCLLLHMVQVLILSQRDKFNVIPLTHVHRQRKVLGPARARNDVVPRLGLDFAQAFLGQV